MMTRLFYESDDRIIRYAEALTERDDEVGIVVGQRRGDRVAGN